MRWLIRQWHRVQLARELLEQYEWEEAHRVPWDQASARLIALAAFPVDTSRPGAAAWRKAVEAQAEKYSSG